MFAGSRGLAAVVLVLALGGCTAVTSFGSFQRQQAPDAQLEDGATPDGARDAGLDGEVPDGGPPSDVGPPEDTGPLPDTGRIDGGMIDAGMPDAGPDGGRPDTAGIDAGPIDAFMPPDTGMPDTGRIDAGPNDAGMPIDAPASVTVTLMRAGDGAGTITGDVGGLACGMMCSASLVVGTAVTLTATPDATSEFAGWSGDGCSGTMPACTVTADRARSITATFNRRRFRVDVALSGDGAGAITTADMMISCDGSMTADCTATYPAGTMVTLTQMPAGASVFSGWSGPCSGTGACSFTLNADTSVGAAFDWDRRSLSVTVAGTGSGAVTSMPMGIDCGSDCTESYSPGTMVTLTATPTTSSTFAGWMGACTGTMPTCTVTMDVARTVTATFNVRRVTLTVMRGGMGTGTVFSITPPGVINCGSSCSTMQDYGAVVIVQASQGLGSTFAGWSGGGCDPGSTTCVVTLNGDVTITASFDLNRQILSAGTSGSGMGTITSTPAGVSCMTGGSSGCTGNFPFNQMVSLAATPAPGSQFVQWSGACGGSAPTCNVTMNADRTVSAQFDLRSYPVAVTKSGTGMGTVSSTVGGISCGATCMTNLVHGTMVTFNATAMPGSTFAGWGGDCASAGMGACTLTITAATNVSATFALGSSLLSVTRNGNGTVTSMPAGINCGSTCASSYTSGTMVTLTAMPAAGHTFMGWSAGPCSGTGTCNVTIGATPVSVTATFVPMRYTLTVNRAGSGTGSVGAMPGPFACAWTGACTGMYDHGTMVTLNATADASSTFTGWSGGGCSGTAPCTVTMDMARTVTATFTLNTYLLDVTREGGGGGSVTSMPVGITCGAGSSSDCSETYNHGTTVTLTATPAAGSMFAGWSGACTGSNNCIVSMTQARSVRARFELITYPLTVMKSIASGGTVMSTDGMIQCGNVCNATYNSGDVVTLTAQAAAGYRFGGWTGACTGATGNCVVTMSQARMVTANFVRQVTLTVQMGSIGGQNPLVRSTDSTLNCFGDGSGCVRTYDAGTMITLNVSPPPPWARWNGWGGACSGNGSCSVTLSADTTVGSGFQNIGNVVFVTSSSFAGGAIGGYSTAQDICEGLARRAGLPAVEYLPWLSDDTQSAYGRLTQPGGGSGWVRPDGAIVVINPRELRTASIRMPISIDENGNDLGGRQEAVWTGTLADGTQGSDCGSWRNVRGSGTVGSNSATHVGWTEYFASQDCDLEGHIYCFGNEATYTLSAPTPPNGTGVIFVSRGTIDGRQGRSAMDTMCRNEATTAGLSGTYVAFVGTTGASASSRITFNGTYVRPDGFTIGTALQVLRAPARLVTGIHQYADRGTVSPLNLTPVWTGMAAAGPDANPAIADHCNGWNPIVGPSGSVGTVGGTLFSDWGKSIANPTAPCTVRLPVLCIRSQ